MEPEHQTRREVWPDGQDEIRASLAAIEQQGHQTLELVRALVGLLLPKEGGREGPTFEELLAALIAQQREAIAVSRATQAELTRLGATLPAEVAEAVQNQTGFERPVRA